MHAYPHVCFYQPDLPKCCLRTEKRDARREAKAETAAQLERAIESELLKRLQTGTYGDIYNFPTKQYEAVLHKAEARPPGAMLTRLWVKFLVLGCLPAVQGCTAQGGGVPPGPKLSRVCKL